MQSPPLEFNAEQGATNYFLSTGMFISPVPLHAAALASLCLQHGGPAPTDPDGNPVAKKKGPSNLLYYQHFKVLKFKR